MPVIALFFGGRNLRGLLADVAWGWKSDEADAEQRRRHQDEDHQIEVQRRLLELEREFPEVARLRELESGDPPPPELPPPEDPGGGGSDDDAR